jgi:uncharacterized protein
MLTTTLDIGLFADLVRETGFRPYLIAAVIALAAMLSSVAGFAFAAFAGSMMFYLVDEAVQAVQIMIVASIATQLMGVLGIWRWIEWRLVAPFVVGGALGLLPGLFLLLNITPETYLRGIGLFLALYGFSMLWRPPTIIRLSHRKGLAADVLVGSLGGALAPLAAFPGAFIPLWCGARGWSKYRQRATYQPYILIMQLGGLGLILLTQGPGKFDPTLALYAMPAILGTQIGLRVFLRLTSEQFRLLLNFLIIAAGLSLAFGHHPNPPHRSNVQSR